MLSPRWSRRPGEESSDGVADRAGETMDRGLQKVRSSGSALGRSFSRSASTDGVLPLERDSRTSYRGRPPRRRGPGRGSPCPRQARGSGPAAKDSGDSGSVTEAGTMLQAITIRLPRCLGGQPEASNRSAGAASRPTGRPGRCPARSSGPGRGPGRVRPRRGHIRPAGRRLRAAGRQRARRGSNAPQASGSGLASPGAAAPGKVAPVAGHLGQEPGLAAPARAGADRGDGQQLGVAAGRARPGRAGPRSPRQ